VSAVRQKTRIEIRAIAQWEVPTVWHRLAVLLEPVLMREEVDNSLDDVQAFLKNGNMQAWVVSEGPGTEWRTAFVTMVQPFGADPQKPTRKVCNLLYCAGEDLDLWMEEAERHFAEWGRSMGCSKLRLVGRMGWMRKISASFTSWRQTCVMMERDL
jgi:hypothetical protein